MDRGALYSIVKTVLKEKYDIGEYRVNSMKLDERYCVDAQGDLAKIKTINVFIEQPVTEIEIKINLNNDESR